MKFSNILREKTPNDILTCGIVSFKTKNIHTYTYIYMNIYWINCLEVTLKYLLYSCDFIRIFTHVDMF